MCTSIFGFSTSTLAALNLTHELFYLNLGSLMGQIEEITNFENFSSNLKCQRLRSGTGRSKIQKREFQKSDCGFGFLAKKFQRKWLFFSLN